MKTKRAGQVKQEFSFAGKLSRGDQPACFVYALLRGKSQACHSSSLQVGSVHAPSVRPCLSTPLHSLSLLSNIGPCLPVLASPKPRLCPPRPFPGPLLSTATPCLPIPLRCFPQRFPSTPRPSCPSIPSSGALQFTPVRSMPAVPVLSCPVLSLALPLRILPCRCGPCLPCLSTPSPTEWSRCHPWPLGPCLPLLSGPIHADPDASHPVQIRCFPMLPCLSSPIRGE
jgi:hypothetical protein